MTTMPKRSFPGWVAYLVTSDGQRKSRLHTLRGDLIPFREMLMVPIRIGQRLLGWSPPGPWMAPPAVRWLRRSARADWEVLEIGSGTSTVWWANRVAHVHTFESDQKWASLVVELLQEGGDSGRGRRVQAVTMHAIPLSAFRSEVDSFQDGMFDAVVVDSAESYAGERIDLALAVAPKIRPGGFLVIDDSDRLEYELPEGAFMNWRALRCRGFKWNPLLATETLILQQPSDMGSA